LDVWGSEGHLKFDLETQTLIVHGRSDLKPTTLGVSAVKEAGQILTGTLGTSLSYLTGRFENTHERLVRDFIDSIRNGSPTPVPPEEGREAVRVMDLLVAQLASGIT
jgi:predicted dehydrogenase